MERSTPDSLYALETGDTELDRALRLALGCLVINTRCMRAGAMEQAGPCLMAGLDYPSPWTRDAAINVYFAAAELYPGIAKNTLLSVLERREDGWAAGGQYWDRIIWVLGAHRLWKTTGDGAWLRFAREVSERTVRECESMEYDPADGLFFGAAVYGDGVSAYPEKYRNPDLSSGISRWSALHPGERRSIGGGLPMKALSLNCLYAHVYALLAEMAQALSLPRREWDEKAEAMRKAIDRRFWDPETGTYDYLAGECRAQEGLGLAFCLLFDIADDEKALSVIEKAYIAPHGIPCVWPAFPPYAENGFGRHSGTVWPHVQGFWALATLHRGKREPFERERHLMAAHAARDGQFAEIYHPMDGGIYGGLQEGGGKYIEWRSCSWQTWSATAFLATVMADPELKRKTNA